MKAGEGSALSEPAIEIRPADKFPEPEFSRLQRLVFADVQQPSELLAATLREEAASGHVANHKHSPIFRIGAYAGAELVGWSYGWMERGSVFYMANSGVTLRNRRKGIYSLLLDAIRKHAFLEGAVAIRSQHSVLNNPVLIAKLRAGFNITGLSQSAQMGTLVELTLHLMDKRQEMYRARALPYVVPDT
jgi:hypothetical protein